MPTPSSRLKPRGASFASFNAHGLQKQIQEVRSFVKSHDLDFFLVQETFLKPHSRSFLHLQSLFALGDSVVLAGDFNSKHKDWCCSTNNTNGNILRRLTNKIGFDVVAPTLPTHFPHYTKFRPDILDMVLLKNISLRLGNIETIDELHSDHRPVLFTLGPLIGRIPTKALMRPPTSPAHGAHP